MDQPVAGLDPAALTTTLTKVGVHLNARPILSFDVWKQLGPEVMAYVKSCPDEQFETIAASLPAFVFDRLTPDEICKVRHSLTSSINAIEDRFEADPELQIVRKISNSIWRWGSGRGYRKQRWNDVVEAHTGIRRLSTGIAGLTGTIDHTTGWNKRGYSEYARVFLDGVFGFLIHHNGEHVMTIGFSISSNRTVLLQQVQLTKRKGNRWLFGLPTSQVEFAIDRIRTAFPKHRIMVADGGEIAQKSLDDYSKAIAAREDWLANHHDTRQAHTGYTASYLSRWQSEMGELQARKDHLAGDVERLKTLYRKTGPYVLGQGQSIGSIVHYTVTNTGPETARQ